MARNPTSGSAALHPVAVFDLDRTLTKRGTWIPFLIFLLGHRRARWLGVPSVLPTLLLWALGRAGRKEVKEATMRAAMAGLSRHEVNRIAEIFAERSVARGLRPGAVGALERHRSDGHHVMLATASMDFYSSIIAGRLGIDSVVSTGSAWNAAGRFIPRIDGENCYGPVKLAAVRQALPWPREDCRIVAYSDHVSDLPLLQWADHGVAVNPRRRFGHIAGSLGLEIVDWNSVPADTARKPENALRAKTARR